MWFGVFPQTRLICGTPGLSVVVLQTITDMTTTRGSRHVDHANDPAVTEAREALVRQMYARYQQGLSLRQVAAEFGKSVDKVRTAFQQRGLDRRPPGGAVRRDLNRPSIEFNGEIYTQNKIGYYTCGRRLLHREVWKYHFGPIADGHQIHHRDRNKANNDISNLECVSLEDHSRFYNIGCNGSVHRCGQPASTEPMTHCHNGHPWTPENTTITKRGWRRCRACKREQALKYSSRLRSSAVAIREFADAVEAGNWRDPEEIVAALREMADRHDRGGAA